LVLANPVSCLLAIGSGRIIGSGAILATLACSKVSGSENEAGGHEQKRHDGVVVIDRDQREVRS